MLRLHISECEACCGIDSARAFRDNLVCDLTFSMTIAPAVVVCDTGRLYRPCTSFVSLQATSLLINSNNYRHLTRAPQPLHPNCNKFPRTTTQSPCFPASSISLLSQYFRQDKYKQITKGSGLKCGQSMET